MLQIRIQDPVHFDPGARTKKVESGIRDKHPRSATLQIFMTKIILKHLSWKIHTFDIKTYGFLHPESKSELGIRIRNDWIQIRSSCLKVSSLKIKPFCIWTSCTGVIFAEFSYDYGWLAQNIIAKLASFHKMYTAQLQTNKYVRYWFGTLYNDYLFVLMSYILYLPYMYVHLVPTRQYKKLNETKRKYQAS